MASKAKKALIALLLAGLIVGAMIGYPTLATLLTMLNTQGGLSSQLNFLFSGYFHHIPYSLSSPLIVRLDMDWLTDIFKNPPPFKIPEDLQNTPVDYIPPIHMFAPGLLDPFMVVMVVEPHNPNYPHQYWKVSTFDYYGEGDWFKTQIGTYPIGVASPSSLPSNAQFFTVWMNISHSTYSSTSLPVLYPDPYFTSGIASTLGNLNWFELERDDYNNSRVTLLFNSEGISEVFYDVAGVPPDTDWISSNALPAYYTPPAIRDVYTQLPSHLVSDPVFTSFAQSFQGVGSNVYEQALAVQAELLSGRYVNNITLLMEGRPLPDEDPVTAFLKTREGTCIDFASTFVTTLRYLGVPARLVIGYYDAYADADYSSGTLRYIVRAYNIYAWAEVWVPTSASGAGTWIPFDPTPPPMIIPPSGMEWFEQQFDIPPDLIGALGPIALFSYGLRKEMQAFNATPENPSSPVRYWRLRAYDYYNGEWNISNRTTYELQTWTKEELEAEHGQMDYYTVLIDLNHQVNMTAALPTPFPGPYILGEAGYALSSIQGDMTSAILLQDILGNVYLNAVFTGWGTSTIKYTAATYNLDLSDIMSSAMRPDPDLLPPEIAQLYLQIPSSLASDPAFISFVSSISDEGNAYEIALNALARLTSGEYTYDLSFMLNGAQVSGDPILWFLNNKSGTPIMFASAFVMALRNHSIPARLVIGYLTKSTTSNGNVVHVATSFSIHAWAEVWIPTGLGVGYWVAFDPTPDPLPQPIFFSDGLLFWKRLPREDPNVQLTNYDVSISAPDTATRGTSFNVSVTAAKYGAPQQGLLVDVYVYDMWEDQLYLKGNGVTNETGSVTVQVIVGNEVKIGNLVVVAKVHSSSSPNSPLVAHNYTVRTVLEGATGLDVDVTSTAPYTGSNTLIRSDGTIRMNGTLYDPVYAGSRKGIPYAPLSVVIGSPMAFISTDLDGYFDYYYPDSISLSLTDYSCYVNYDSTHGHFGSSTSTAVTINVYARSYITLTLTPPNAVKKGSSLTFTAQLTLDNGSPIPSRTNVYALMASTSIPLNDDDGNGIYESSITVNVDPGYYNVYAKFDGTVGGGGRILNSTSKTVNILVYSGGLILIDDYPSEVYRGYVAWLNGTVKDEYDNPKEGIMLQFTFSNASGVVYTYNADEMTGPDGSFYCDVPIPSWLSAGTYDVSALSLNETFTAMSNVVTIQVKIKPSVIVSGFSSLSASSLTAKQASTVIGSFMPGEYAFITATVVDSSSQTPLSGLNFTVYYNGVPLSTGVTDADGFLNITLEPEDISQLPVNLFSVLTVNYPGNETISPVQFEVRIHVFDDATLSLDVPGRAVAGKPLTINVSVRDPNGNPVIGRAFTVYWNRTINVGSAKTGNGGKGSFTYNIPAETAEGNLTIYVVLDSGDSAMVSIPVVKEDFTGGYIMALMYALQAGDSQPVLPLFIVVILAALLVVLFFVYMSRKKSAGVKKPKLTWNLEALDELVKAGKYRDAVIRLYRMYVELLNVHLKIERAPHETTRDIARKAIKGGLPPKLVNTITQLFEKARFSKHETTNSDYKDAVKAFNDIYKEITGGILNIG